MPENRTPDCQGRPLRVEPSYMLDSGKLFELILGHTTLEEHRHQLDMQQVHRIRVGSDTVKSETWFKMVCDTQYGKSDQSSSWSTEPMHPSSAHRSETELPPRECRKASNRCCRSGSESGSTFFWASWILLSPSKKSKKNLDSYCFVNSFWLFIFENDVQVVPSKINKQKKTFHPKMSWIRNTARNTGKRRYRMMETRWWPDKQIRGPWCPDTLWAALPGPRRVILQVFQVSK